MSSWKISSALCLVTLLLAAGLASADQDLFVSKKAPKKIHQLPHAAVNPNNGDMLVVWSSGDLNDLNYARVWSAFVKTKASGKLAVMKPRRISPDSAKYKVKKSRMISPDSGYHYNARVAWIPGNEEFFVVWDDYDFFQFQIDPQPTSIWGQRIKAKNGKPVGARIEIISDGNANFAPWIEPIANGGVPEINLIYSRYVLTIANPTSNVSETPPRIEAVSQRIDIKSHPRLKGKYYIIKEGGKTTLELCTNNVFKVPGSHGCQVMLFTEFNNSYIKSQRVVLVRNNKFMDEYIHYPGYGAGLCSIRYDPKHDLIQIVGVDYSAADCNLWEFKVSPDCKKLIPQGKKYIGIPGFAGTYVTLLTGRKSTSWQPLSPLDHTIKPAAQEESVYIAHNGDSEWVMLQKLKVKKKVKVRSEEKLFRHFNMVKDFEGIDIGILSEKESSALANDRPHGAILWTKGVKDSDWQIWLHIISPDQIGQIKPPQPLYNYHLWHP